MFPPEVDALLSLKMMVLEPREEMVIVPINKRTHRVYLRDETESAVNVYIEPLSDEPIKEEKEQCPLTSQ